jgi:argininosuccinate lyase
MTRGVALSDLADEEFAREYPGWNAALRAALGPHNAVERMVSQGSTAPASVAAQLAAWRERLAGLT